MPFARIITIFRSLVLALILLACGSACATSAGACNGDAVDGIAIWERQMRHRGRHWGDYFDPDNGIDDRRKLVNEFYDSANTFYQISDYLGEQEPWSTYAKWALDLYVDTYLIPNGWQAAGWRRSSMGLYQDYLRGGRIGRDELALLRDRPAFSRVREARGQGGSEHMSRAIALAAQSQVYAERAGVPRKTEGDAPQMGAFIPWMGSHMYEWRSGDYRGSGKDASHRFAPFMFGLTAHSLIQYVEWERERGADPNAYWPASYPIDYGQGLSPDRQAIDWPDISAALADLAEWTMLSSQHRNGERMWRDRDKVFLYDSIDQPKAAGDLNLMIAHVYGWLWKETGDLKFREMGDAIFSGGARNSTTVTGKHFNQQYRMAFDYLKWRAMGDALHCSRLR